MDICRQLLGCLLDQIRDDSARQSLALAQKIIDQQERGFDDVLDSCIAHVLGDLWLRNSGDVILLGDLDTGAILLPNVDGLRDKWEEFLIAASKKPQAVAQG